MRAFAVVTCFGGEHVVGHGDLIGRTPTAAIVIDDPRVSEAHAIVSVRKGKLMLLSLRRLVIANGSPVSEVELFDGLRIVIADELELVVHRVVVPPVVLAIAMPSGERQLLPQIASITTLPPRLHGKLLPDARAVIWSTGERWSVREGAATRALEPGTELVLDGQRFAFELVPIGQASAASTDGGEDVVAPLRIVAFYDSVHVYQRGQRVHAIGGTGARIISELVACGGPTYWEVLAREVWPDEVETLPLRKRWDVALGRLRQRLRLAGLRQLVRADGNGQLSLETYVGDTVEDHT